jgi:hypothetical protein
MNKIFKSIVILTALSTLGCNSGGGSGGGKSGSTKIEVQAKTEDKFIFQQDDSRPGKITGQIEFTVTTNSGKEYISGINSENFTFLDRVYDSTDTSDYIEEVEATLSSDVEVNPIDVMYLIDTSYSVVQAGAENDVIKQANQLVKSINKAINQPSSSITYRQFSDGVGFPMSGSGDEPFENLDFDKSAGGGTALYQAIETTLEDLIDRDEPQLFVFTDGKENASLPGYGLETVINKAKAYGVTIHIAGLGAVDKDQLELIATETGGGFSVAQTVKGLSSAFKTVVSSIPVTYTATYKPTQRSGNIEFEFRVNYLNAEDSIFDEFDIEEILGN